MDEGDDRLLMVPVRPGRCGSVAVRTGRLDTGERVGLAFTSTSALAEVFGSRQQWIPLNGAVARQMFEQAGAVQMRIDALPVPGPVMVPTPVSVAAPAAPAAAARRRPRLRLAHLSLAIRHAQ